MNKLKVIYPAAAHTAYKIAAEEIKRIVSKINNKISVTLVDDEQKVDFTDKSSSYAIIGTDGTNKVASELYFSGKIDDFGVKYCTEEYNVFTVEKGIIVFAAGRPRSALYAVYRFFEVYCGCKWFWDGERINNCDIPDENISLFESPRFEYRGVRYFAHRSLTRFQAEMWGFDDWMKEIDWLLKKRFNMFMLRIGLDDIYQKAFPECVKYPPFDKPIPEAGEGFDDRSLFWSLEHRGELRKKILAYAFERDLLHPEDCGTMTHWYSRTPVDFLESKKPTLLTGQVTGIYKEKTGLVWDIRNNENLKNYFKLTDTHVKEYGKGEIFHTIGLAERRFSAVREENLRLKLYVYHRIATYLKENYPSAPLLIASWDLWMYYTHDEVKKLFSSLDKNQAVLFDYTSDTVSKNNFTSWDVVGKFPWIFGVFSAYEPDNDIRGKYSLISERLKIAKSDKMCKGLVLWPETSHGDIFAEEYTSYNGWTDDVSDIKTEIKRFVTNRYDNKIFSLMLDVWESFFPLVEAVNWESQTKFGRILTLTHFEKGHKSAYGEYLSLVSAEKSNAADILLKLSSLENNAKSDEMLYRDIIDISRTVIARYLDFSIMKWETNYNDGNNFSADIQNTKTLLNLMTSLLSLSDDFSLAKSLENLSKEDKVNPNFELVLKHNSEVDYCRSFIWENCKYLYIPETEYLADATLKGGSLEIVKERAKNNREKYFDTPFCAMKKENAAMNEILASAAEIIKNIQ